MPELAQNSRVATMTDRGETSESNSGNRHSPSAGLDSGRVTTLRELAAFVNRFELLTGGVAPAIVAPQIAKRLFTFENRCRSHLLGVSSIRRDIRMIPAFWQADFHCTGGISLCLGP